MRCIVHQGMLEHECSAVAEPWATDLAKQCNKQKALQLLARLPAGCSASLWLGIVAIQ